MKITVRIYNATGDNVSRVRKENWDGDYDSSPPDTIKANEETEFVIDGSDATSGAVVYRVNNPDIHHSDGVKYDCMVAYSNPETGQNKVFCKCSIADYFDDDAMKEIKTGLNDSVPFHRDASDVVVTRAAITRENTATCVATIGKFVA